MINAIYQRKSVRSFAEDVFTNQDYQFIKKEIKNLNELTGPFQNKFDFFYIENKEGNPNESRKIGTYGFVRNAHAFIGGASLKDFKSIVDYGYLLEYLILKLTKREIATVWLGGTFQRELLSDKIKMNQIIPAITAIGYESSKKYLKERLIRTAIHADSRKPFNQLFFEEDWTHPVHENHHLSKVLDLVRVAPSASNKQPWRILIKDKILHLYLDRTPNYGGKLDFDIQALDMGIALCHLEVGLKEEHIEYEMYEDSKLEPNNKVYVLSIKLHI